MTGAENNWKNVELQHAKLHDNNYSDHPFTFDADARSELGDCVMAYSEKLIVW
jgi:hypothetical protein